MTATVLIVDDDRTLVEMVAFMLKRAGFETRAAHDGVRALQVLNSEPIDIVVLDVMLPSMDGFEICRRIRALPRAGHLPILMLSARSQVTDRLDGFEAGADDYVAKPVAIKEIIARVRTLLTRFQRARGTLPRLLTFIGAKGGVGNTTLALNVASTLVGNRPKVVLLELGGVGLSGARMLGLQLKQTLLDLGMGQPSQLSMDDLQRCILIHSSGLHYIPGYAREIPLAGYTPALLGETIERLLSEYDMAIIDLGPATLGIGSEVLARSSLIVPVTEREDVSIWHLQALLERLEQDKLRSKVPGFVLVDRSPGSAAVPAAIVANELGLEALAIIPPAAEALRFANNCQQPLCLLRPDNPAALVMAQLSRRLTTMPIELPTPPSTQGPCTN
jgi:CheY-like chemotaxis protein/MinD-like ATPase involved in chromosome partitioning or flagellar assembly